MSGGRETKSSVSVILAIILVGGFVIYHQTYLAAQSFKLVITSNTKWVLKITTLDEGLRRSQSFEGLGDLNIELEEMSKLVNFMMMSKLVEITVKSPGETTELDGTTSQICSSMAGKLYEVTLSHSPFSEGFIELSIYKNNEEIFTERRDSWDPLGITWRE